MRPTGWARRNQAPDLKRYWYLVEGVHGEQNHPGNVQRFNDLVGYCGFTRCASTTETCSRINDGEGTQTRAVEEQKRLQMLYKSHLDDTRLLAESRKYPIKTTST